MTTTKAFGWTGSSYDAEYEFRVTYRNYQSSYFEDCFGNY